MAPVLDLPLNVGQIDDVQELKKGRKTKIPIRFVRDVAERPMLAATPSPLLSSIPVIDLKKLMSGNKEEFHLEILKLSASCEEWGFFQVINHAIEVDLLEKIEKMAMEFFMLPVEEKQKYPMAPGTVQGYGQAFVFSEDQKLDWCNMFAIGLVPHSIRNPKLWPTNPPMFRSASSCLREERCDCSYDLRVSKGMKGWESIGSSKRSAVAVRDGAESGGGCSCSIHMGEQWS
ncbi:hypothetical protein L1987_09544 [Smallanthus sonchifolius]|uniref:Uncharacterized protein n=1 Tax=Smallanthus sonchifolius TaxID=185202 RepID=A0ACB9JPM8_9ASTR|nr:hypothetical protein L1987_09544 [Smallanthus sonchifolius]